MKNQKTLHTAGPESWLCSPEKRGGVPSLTGMEKTIFQIVYFALDPRKSLTSGNQKFCDAGQSRPVVGLSLAFPWLALGAVVVDGPS